MSLGGQGRDRGFPFVVVVADDGESGDGGELGLELDFLVLVVLGVGVGGAVIDPRGEAEILGDGILQGHADVGARGRDVTAW